MENVTSKSIFSLTIDDECQYNLKELAKWAKFLAVIGMILMGLIVIIGIIASISLSKLATFYGSGGEKFLMMFVYIIIAAIYVYPIYTLFNFGKFTKHGLVNSDQVLFNKGIQNLKSCFKFMGIFTIVILSIYGIIFIILLITSASNLL